MQLLWCNFSDATSPLQFFQPNSGINQFQTQEIKQVLQVQEEEQFQEIEAEDVGAMMPCGWLAAMDSAPTPNATSLVQLL